MNAIFLLSVTLSVGDHSLRFQSTTVPHAALETFGSKQILSKAFEHLSGCSVFSHMSDSIVEHASRGTDDLGQIWATLVALWRKRFVPREPAPVTAQCASSQLTRLRHHPQRNCRRVPSIELRFSSARPNLP